MNDQQVVTAFEQGVYIIFALTTAGVGIFATASYWMPLVVQPTV